MWNFGKSDIEVRNEQFYVRLADHVYESAARMFY